MTEKGDRESDNPNDKIYIAVEEAPEIIKEHDVACWQEVHRQIFPCLYEAATMTTPGKSWEECPRSFVKKAFQGYVSACGRRDWFYALDLSPVFARIIWEIFAIRCRLVPNLSF